MTLPIKDWASQYSNISDRVALIPSMMLNSHIPKDSRVEFQLLGLKEQSKLIAFMNTLADDLGTHRVALVCKDECLFNSEDPLGFTKDKPDYLASTVFISLVVKGCEIYPSQYRITRTTKQGEVRIPSPQYLEWKEASKQADIQTSAERLVSETYEQMLSGDMYQRDVLAEALVACFIANTSRISRNGTVGYLRGSLYALPGMSEVYAVNLSTGNICNLLSGMISMGNKGREIITVEYLGHAETFLVTHQEQEKWIARCKSHITEYQQFADELKQLFQSRTVERSWVIECIEDLFGYLDALEEIVDKTKQKSLKNMVLINLKRAVEERTTETDTLR